MCLNHFLLSHIRLLLSNGKWRGSQRRWVCFFFFFLDCSSVCAWVRTWPDHNWMCHILRLFERLCLKRNLLRFMALSSSFSTVVFNLKHHVSLRRQQQSWKDFQMNMIGFFTFTGQEIKRSPFNVKIGPHKTSKIKAYGPGLKGGIVNKPARFTVDTCGETGALGFSIEGPSQVEWH